MTQQQPVAPPAAPETPPEGKAPGETRKLLDDLKEVVTGKKKVGDLVQELLADYKNLPPEERKDRIMGILGVAALGFLFGKKGAETEDPSAGDKAKDKPAKSSDATGEGQKEEAEESETEESEETALTGIEKARQVEATHLREICINTDPAGSRAPSAGHHNPTYLLAYGLPDYDTFKTEMIGILAPKAKTEAEGIETAMRVLRVSPMGKYQCMPLFLFKPIGLSYEGEQGLRDMHKFLKSEPLQRRACRAYLENLSTKNPRYLAAAYYGGADEIAKMKEFDAGKTNNHLTDDQKGYPSIVKYADSVGRIYAGLIAAKNATLKLQGKEPDESYDIELMLDAIAKQESGNLEGHQAKPRDEKWENDKRYAHVKRDGTQMEGTNEAPKASEAVAKIDVTEFRKGDLFESLAKHCPYAVIESGLRLESKKPVTVQGIPGWEKGRRTEGWDFRAAGNTDELIQQGIYKVDMVEPINRNKSAPRRVHKKLEQIAIALQFDPRMPLFNGINMVVDGVKVTMVKEIHCTNRDQTSSKTIGQPHTGTAYIVRT